MAYNEALNRAWNRVTSLTDKKAFNIRLLSESYSIDLSNITVKRSSDNTPAKDYANIILLHYLAKRLELKMLPEPTGEWINFTQLEGGEAYYPVFKKRVIDMLVKKYGFDPDALLKKVKGLNSKKAAAGDVGIIIDAMDKVPVMITMWRPDEELGPSANILFDRTIKEIFCTEDIVVLSEMLAHSV